MSNGLLVMFGVKTCEIDQKWMKSHHNVQPAPFLPVLPNEVKCQSSDGSLKCI